MAFAFEPGKGFSYTEALNSLGLVGDVAIPAVGMGVPDYRKKVLLSSGMSGLGEFDWSRLIDWIPEGSVSVGETEIPYWAIVAGLAGFGLLLVVTR